MQFNYLIYWPKCFWIILCIRVLVQKLLWISYQRMLIIKQCKNSFWNLLKLLWQCILPLKRRKQEKIQFKLKNEIKLWRSSKQLYNFNRLLSMIRWNHWSLIPIYKSNSFQKRTLKVWWQSWNYLAMLIVFWRSMKWNTENNRPDNWWLQMKKMSVSFIPRVVRWQRKNNIHWLHWRLPKLIQRCWRNWRRSKRITLTRWLLK